MRVAPIIDQTCTPQFPRASSLDTASHDLITWPGKGRNVCEAMSSVITGNGRRVEGSARLVCALRKSDGCCIAHLCRFSYPLRITLLSARVAKTDAVSRPQALTAYALTLGGGIVSGDSLSTTLKVERNAALLLISQSTLKGFKHIGNRATTRCTVVAECAKGGLLALVPHPSAPFSGCALHQSTTVRLCHPSASLLAVEWYVGGRRHHDGERWSFRRFSSKVQVELKDNMYTSPFGSPPTALDDNTEDGWRPLLKDYVCLWGGQELRAHMQSYTALASVYVVGTRLKKECDSLIQHFASRSSYSTAAAVGFSECPYSKYGMMVSCSPWPANHLVEGVVLRIAARGGMEQIAAFLSTELSTLHGQLQFDPFKEIAPDYEWHQVNDGVPTTLSHTEKSGGLQHKPLEDVAEHFPPPIRGKKDGFLSVVWQMTDSSFPTGGFNQSFSLEVASKVGAVTLRGGIEQFILDSVLQGITLALPFVRLTWDIIGNCIPQDKDLLSPITLKMLAHVNATYHCCITSKVMRDASLQLGTNLIRAYSAMFGDSIVSACMQQLRIALAADKMTTGSSGGHFVVVIGLACGLLSMNFRLCSEMFVYMLVRDLTNAGIRLNLIGPLEGARVLHRCLTESNLLLDMLFDAASAEAENNRPPVHLPLPRVAFTPCPLLSVLADAHSRLYTRLFSS